MTMLLRSRCGSDCRSSRLKAELLEDGAFLSTEDAQTEIFDYIEVYHNRVRKHCVGSLVVTGLQKPEQFEKQYYKT